MIILKITLKRIQFYWRYAIIIFLALLALNTIPVILKGVSDGNKKALRQNIIEAQKGEYVLKAYSNGDYSKPSITDYDINKIDIILKEAFPEEYLGFTTFIKGSLFLSIESTGYRARIEADDSIEDGVVFLNEEFAPGKSLKQVGYRVSEVTEFYDDCSFYRKKIDKQVSSNPLLDVKNELFFYYPDMKASYNTTRKMLGFPMNTDTGMILRFSCSPSFSELENVLSKYYSFWKHNDTEGIANGVIKTKVHTINTVLFFDNLDDDLINITMNIIDNGQATSYIKNIDRTISRINRIIIFLSFILPVVIFMTELIELDSRRKEIQLTLFLGGTEFKVFSFLVIEKLIIAFIAITISLFSIGSFYFLYHFFPLQDSIESIFTRNNFRVFVFDFALFLKLSGTSFLIAIIASCFAVFVTPKGYKQ